MMRLARWLALAALTVSGPAASLAQPRRPGPPPAAPDDDPAAVAARRDQLKKRIRAERAARLTAELSLDEQGAARMVAVLDRYDAETDKLLARRIDLQRQLRRVGAPKGARDPREIDRLIDEAVTNQRAFWDMEDRRLVDLRKALTPVQAAKLIVVLPDLERQILNKLRKAIADHRPGPGAARGKAEATDDDDDREPDEIGPRPPPPQPKLRRREAPLVPIGPPSNAPGNTPPMRSE